MRTAVKVFVALHQMRQILVEGAESLTKESPIASAPPPDSDARTGREGLVMDSVAEGSSVPMGGWYFLRGGRGGGFMFHVLRTVMQGRRDIC